MPMINIEFDQDKVSNEDVQILSKAVQKIVSETTDIEDVFVYANSSKITYKIAPIEIWVRMSAWKIKNLDELTEAVKTKLSLWKKETSFNHPINLTLIPMNWKVEIDI